MSLQLECHAVVVVHCICICFHSLHTLDSTCLVKKAMYFCSLGKEEKAFSSPVVQMEETQKGTWCLLHIMCYHTHFINLTLAYLIGFC